MRKTPRFHRFYHIFILLLFPFFATTTECGVMDKTANMKSLLLKNSTSALIANETFTVEAVLEDRTVQLSLFAVHVPPMTDTLQQNGDNLKGFEPCVFRGFELQNMLTSFVTIDGCREDVILGTMILNNEQFALSVQGKLLDIKNEVIQLHFIKQHPYPGQVRKKRQSQSWLDLPSVKPLKVVVDPYFSKYSTQQKDYFRLLNQVTETFLFNKKTISLSVYVDKDFNANFASERALKKYLHSLVNMVDMIMFSNLYHTHVVLDEVNVWAVNLVDISANVEKTLKNFLMHLNTVPQLPSSTVTLLLTGERLVVPFEHAANYRSICDPEKAAGVIRISPDKHTDQLETPNTVALVLGQILGLTYDSSSACNCSEGCIMSKFSPYVFSKFSLCSKNEFLQLMFSGRGHCLFDEPKTIHKAHTLEFCGNGRIDPNEECDCGSKLECALSGHSGCCHNCKLSSFAQCGGGECCDSQCRLKSNGTLCRERMGECDVAENCNGVSHNCPANVYKIDATPCNQDQDFCFNGECLSRDHQCQLLYGIQSKSGVDLCYENLNSDGSEYGNCGDLGGGKFRPCYKQNVYCGMLQCNGSLSTSVRIEKVRRFRFNAFNSQHNSQQSISDKCSGASVVLDDGTDVGYVAAGTKCGHNKVCSSNNQCLDIRTNPAYLICPGHDRNTGHFCSHHGFCSNSRLCVCDYGWVGSDCSIPDEKFIRENQIPKDDPSTPAEKLHINDGQWNEKSDRDLSDRSKTLRNHNEDSLSSEVVISISQENGVESVVNFTTSILSKTPPGKFALPTVLALLLYFFFNLSQSQFE